MSAPLTLDPATVEAIAERVAELLEGGGIASRLTQSPELIDAAEVARRFNVSRDYVYEHADELGAIRLGIGKRPPLRFDPALVAEGLAPRPHPVTALDRPRPRRPARGRVELLPIKGPTP